MTSPIDIRPDHLATVQDILRAHLPHGAQAWVFGSRATWTTKDSSDLDLAVQATGKIAHRAMGGLEDAFRESDLPYTVDVVDLSAVDGQFKQVVESQKVSLPLGPDRADERSEWRKVMLGELCKFRAGSVFKLQYQGQNTGDYPFIKVSDMNLPMNRVNIHGANNWISHSVADVLRAEPFPPDTIVFAKIGEGLKHNRLRMIIRPTVIDNNMMGAIPKPTLVDPHFLYYAMHQFDLGDVSSGTALPYLTVPALAELPLRLPPMAQQRDIAHILGTLDDKIDLNRRMNETLEEMARAIFKSWFVDYDPVRAKIDGRWRRGESLPGLPADLYDLFPARMVESELGEVPEGWEVRALGEVVEYLRNNENPFKDPETMFTHFSIPAHDEGQMPRQELGANIKSAKSSVPSGSVLFSRINPEIERVWLVDMLPDDRAVCSTEFMVLGPQSHFQRYYTYCLGRSPSFRQQVESLVTGTSKSHQRAPASAVLSLKVVVPPEHVIGEFETVASAFLSRTLANRRESQTLGALRDILLPRLVSGEVGVGGSR